MKKYTILLLSLLLIGINGQAKDKNKKLPTIQEAWVDTGFFVWADSTQTSLRITEEGATQEILPDVCDGEQLTSAYLMFSQFEFTYDKTGEYKMFSQKVRLKRAPMFDTQNITNFEYVFRHCSYLTSIPLYNTSKGTDFQGMFGCSSLTSIPLIDTSNGTNFSKMFEWLDLTSIPKLDTSNGTDFSLMFNFCEHLKDIPLLDTSKGTDFSDMFKDCSSLKKSLF